MNKETAELAKPWRNIGRTFAYYFAAWFFGGCLLTGLYIYFSVAP